ncbi:Phosphate-selective porin O and P [Aquisphaera giovannonii]|uniref:Phosphate-selective porin O and P n=1 Tax=Aquisphaera giovannonii TaxID=406548 RepID=A0A5B9VUB0_9BACT|nr:porin [Aquisphaera giovannonii]QEH31664.1 Phosphate-selective porin O and P [Aquisphaera giovannonii]
MAAPFLAGALGILLAGVGVEVRAQEPAPAPPAPTPSPDGASREAQLEDEVRQLKDMVRQLSTRVEELSQSIPARPDGAATGSGAEAGPGAASGRAGAGAGANAGAGRSPSAGPSSQPDISASTGGSAAPRSVLDPRRTSRFNMPGMALDLPAKVKFGPGFEIQTEDTEYQLQFHNLTQMDGRFYTQAEQTPVHSTFLLPREWYIFSGRLGKPFEYYVAIAQGIDNVNLLDSYLNVNFDPRMNVKIGRYKTPFTYEFYGLGINAMPTPERSLFYNNFGLNRDIGLMAYGALYDKRFDYAVGIFNGTRNGYVDSNDFKDVAALINFRPFTKREGSVLESLNFGGSVNSGLQNSVPIPTILRTNVPTTGNTAIGPQFLTFNSNVRENGLRSLWSLHAAYYYRQLSLIAEWQGGYQSYAPASDLTRRTRLPVDSYYVTLAYFLTGETVSGRGVLKPNRNFDLRKGKFGLGAFELVTRYNYLGIGDQVFTAGLADPNLWTNHLYTVDVGVNWYWSQFVKVYLGWQRAEFGSPVVYAPDRFQRTSDQLWMRFQVYF